MITRDLETVQFESGSADEAGMSGYTWFEKALVGIAAAALFCSLYFFSQVDLSKEKTVRREMPVGKISLSKGDTRWKSESQVHHFKTWDDQRLYAGDSLYAGPGARLGFKAGEILIDLKSQTRVTLRPITDRFTLEANFGELEIHLPPGSRMRLSLDQKFLDLGSVNGGRVLARVEEGRQLRVLNLAGDLVVRTQGNEEHTIPEEKFFTAGPR